MPYDIQCEVAPVPVERGGGSMQGVGSETNFYEEWGCLDSHQEPKYFRLTESGLVLPSENKGE